MLNTIMPKFGQLTPSISGSLYTNNSNQRMGLVQAGVQAGVTETSPEYGSGNYRLDIRSLGDNPKDRVQLTPSRYAFEFDLKEGDTIIFSGESSPTALPAKNAEDMMNQVKNYIAQHESGQ